jgi:hypothetical protein
MSEDKWTPLERLAKAATPGPWLNTEVCKFVLGGITEFVGFKILGRDDERVHSETDGVEKQENAAFIAAANPAAILELIAAARQQPNREG